MEAQIKYIAAAISALIFSVVVMDLIVIWLMTIKRSEKITKKGPRTGGPKWGEPDRWDKDLAQALKDPGKRITVNERCGFLPLPEAKWHPVTEEIPINMRVDVKTKKQTFTGVVLTSKKPPTWRPEFIRYKKIIEWRYSNVNKH